MEEIKKNKKKKIIRVAGLLGLFLLVFGVSYALFSVVLNGTKRNKITTGNLDLRLIEVSGAKRKSLTRRNNGNRFTRDCPYDR